MTFPEFFFSSSPSTSSKDIQAAPVGASVAEVQKDHFDYHHYLLKWIQETKQKLPAATPALRREAFEADPLLKGTIYPYLKNVLLQGFTIQTEDNKLYAEAITEITAYLEQLELMQCFREDFLNFMILDGHSYRRMDPDKDQNVIRLEKLDPSSMTVYNDPWESSVVAYHQRAMVKKSWSRLGTTEQVDSWFIPFGQDIKDIYGTHIYGREQGNDQAVYDLFETYKTNYNIIDITNLRIASSERVIAMHNTERLQAIQADYEDMFDRENYNPAPIDAVILAIWLKRLLLVNAPNLIYVVLSPFLHLISGKMLVGKDSMGNDKICTTVPSLPTANSFTYAQEMEAYNNWVKSVDDGAKNLLKTYKNGGIYASGPDHELKTIESARSVSEQFVKGLADMMDEEIGSAFGFPISLIKATGTELASSRNILENFNVVHAGERTEYEAVADRLIWKMFEGRTWTGITTEKGDDGESKDVQVTYSFEDIAAHFILDTPDTKDLLNEAQAYKTYAEALVQLKSVGASDEDLQALCDEWGFGVMELGRNDIPFRDLHEAVNTETIEKDVFLEKTGLKPKTKTVSE